MWDNITCRLRCSLSQFCRNNRYTFGAQDTTIKSSCLFVSFRQLLLLRFAALFIVYPLLSSSCSSSDSSLRLIQASLFMFLFALSFREHSNWIYDAKSFFDSVLKLIQLQTRDKKESLFNKLSRLSRKKANLYHSVYHSVYHRNISEKETWKKIALICTLRGISLG